MVDSLIECKFLWWFHGYERRYRGKVVNAVKGAAERSAGCECGGGGGGGCGDWDGDGGADQDANEVVRKVESLREGIWWVPRWRFWVLKAAVAVWVVVMLPLFLR